MFDTITEACEFNDINEMIFENMMNSIEFQEFCEFIEAANEMFTDDVDKVFDESYTGTNTHKQGKFRKILSNTRDTTRQVSKAYGNITTSSGNLLKTSFDLVMKLFNVGVKAVTFVLDKMTLLPKMVLGLINKGQKINVDIRSKIAGNLALYIQVDDLQMLYENDLVEKFEEFFRQSAALVKGEAWAQLHNKTPKRKADTEFTIFDIRHCKKMTKIYNEMKTMQFHPVIVDMKNPLNRDLYFGGKKISIATGEYTYCEGLQLLMNSITKMKEPMQILVKDMEEKIANAKTTEGNWSELSPRQVNIVKEAVNSTARMSTLLSSLLVYISKDINTINGAMNKILGIPANKK